MEETLTCRLPSGTELGYVAGAMTRLHLLEHGSPLAPGATEGRALRFLADMLNNDRGAVATDYSEAQGLSGCVVMQFGVIPQQRSMLVGGLYVAPDAPRHTVLRLMAGVIAEADRRGMRHLYLLANTDKNRTRRSYRRLGFSDTGLSDGGSQLFTASVEAARRGLAEMQKGKREWAEL